MKEVQEIFNTIQARQKEQKTIRGMYRDVLANSQEYQSILEELEVLKTKKRKTLEALKMDLRSEMDELDKIKSDIDSEKELLSHATLSKLIKGEQLEIVDENNNKYEPIFSVRFKKF
ncbi:hypothetical protein CVU82_01765 [Candidatus Falkowbacteria bacterium HGW-Falkowbacteria-1]|uniref:Uncharacterized protein n=1 Tax=Candidatus Falkowbacteria bacterium HGW-Falkowbacteria-1 TaxID=2013768 RepID=A0A2N2E9F5_9BACT|nr:MAG: hypothetical protein CVU82_01765 [Candidatus Falkowbacteria bacterium HGW-Falkowbacteria-1]